MKDYWLTQKNIQIQSLLFLLNGLAGLLGLIVLVLLVVIVVGAAIPFFLIVVVVVFTIFIIVIIVVWWRSLLPGRGGWATFLLGLGWWLGIVVVPRKLVLVLGIIVAVESCLV